jgi:hypothetical protein
MCTNTETEDTPRRVIDTDQRLAAIEDMAGLGWEGDLDIMRGGNNVPTSF